MKRTTVFFTLMGLLLSGSVSQALVQRLGVCDTPDGNYRIMIFNNEGIGIEREAHYGAAIYDEQGQVRASYPVTAKHIGSISFGRKHYLDTAQQGQQFDLAFGSTNFHNIYIKAQLDNGETLVADNLECSR